MLRMCGLEDFARCGIAACEHANVPRVLIQALERRLERPGESDCARVVHEHVDSAEGGDRLVDRRANLLLHAHVDDAGEHPRRSRCLHLFLRGVDGARKLRVGLRGLRRDDDVRPVARGAEANGLADAAARAGDEDCLALQRIHLPALWAFRRFRRAFGLVSPALPYEMKPTRSMTNTSNRGRSLRIGART
jgi:hypothetical protein